MRELDTIDVCIILTDLNHLESPGAGLKQILLHNCRIIVSVSLGYRESASRPIDSTVDTGWSEAMLGQVASLVFATAADTFHVHNENEAWIEKWRESHLLHYPETVLGLVGMGRVGKCLANKAAFQDMRVKYFDFGRLNIDDEANYQAWYCHSVQELFSESDVVLNPVLVDGTSWARRSKALKSRSSPLVGETVRKPHHASGLRREVMG